MPLNFQDRSVWDSQMIQTAQFFLKHAAHTTTTISDRFYFEALIAQEHGLAAQFELTDWPKIVWLYDQWLNLQSSPVVALNRAVALNYSGKTEQAIQVTSELLKEKPLSKSHLGFAALALFHATLGQHELFVEFLQQAKGKGATPHELDLLLRQAAPLLGKSVTDLLALD